MKNKKTNETCRRCNGQGKPSKAFNNTLVEFTDLGSKIGDRGNTLSRIGKAQLVDCIKCENCGHSWIPKKSTRELAISWWNKEGREQEILAMQYFERSCFNLTGREIEEIWLIEGDYEQAVYNNPSIKDQALEWWNNLSENKQKSLNIKYFGQFDPYEDNSLSNSEIEKIWIKETQEELPNDSTSFEEVMYGKPNQKQLPKELEGVIPRVLTIEEKIEEVKKWHNAKQFKEFNPELFKAYIDKFANENKPDAIKILAESLPNSNLKSYILNWFTV
jgi:ribosomal protein L37E